MKKPIRIWRTIIKVFALGGCGKTGFPAIKLLAQGDLVAEMAFEPMSFFDEVAAVLPDPPPDGKPIGESFERLE